MEALAGHVARLGDAGWLSVADPRAAATFLNWLVMGEPVNRAMLLGDERLPDAREISVHCAEAVRIFLAAYEAPRPVG